MYCDYYGFSEKPFNTTSDPKFLYFTPGHREALAALLYCISEGLGFVILVGDVGVGKTTILKAAQEQLKKKIRTALIYDNDFSFESILNMILDDLKVLKHGETLSKAAAIARLNLYAKDLWESGKSLVIMVDEAQNLSNENIENLRLLSNLESTKHKMIQIVLAGQPEFELKLSRFQLHQFTQRINLRRYISPLNKIETYAYVQHRLNISRYQGPLLFSKKSIELIWDYSQGVPRKINILCDNALLIAYAINKKFIEADIVERAISDLDPYFLTKNGKNKMSIYNNQLVKVASVVVAVCLIFTFGISLVNSQLKLRESTTPQNYKVVIPSVKSNRIKSEKSLNLAQMKHQAKIKTVSDGAFVDLPKEKIDMQTKMAIGQIQESHEPKEDIIVQGKSNRDFSEIKTKSELDNTDSNKIDQEIIFKVQFISSTTRLPTNSPEFKGLKNVWEYKQDNLYKYTLGNKKDLKSAIALQSELRKTGFGGAFVVTFKNGKRIPVKEAMRLLN